MTGCETDLKTWYEHPGIRAEWRNRCVVCETEYTAGWEAHHGIDISNGGDPGLTIPYCHDCHKSAERQRLYRQHIQAPT